MHRSEIDARYAATHALCQRAGALALAGFRSTSVEISEKGRHDLVTNVDLQIDALFQDELRRAFPDDGILTEESLGQGASAMWVVDPIDGTQNFARGIAHFAISVAFVADGTVEFGVVYNPATAELFAARRGEGASLNGQPIRASQVTAPGRAVIDIGYSTKLPQSRYVALLDRALSAGFSFVQQGSAALGLAQVACRRIDGYVEEHLYSWDVLAGLLLVEEAGGWSMPFALDRDFTQGQPVLASARALQTSLSEVAQTQFWTGGSLLGS
ncbi:inositol monophosphatase family protein [Devosia sp. 2618]|uniref:inositol monophosphatase family protein n=1 Tax=Devosia sp. 2618 TaxID=3156454 RepID=UPI00339A48EE